MPFTFHSVPMYSVTHPQESLKTASVEVHTAASQSIAEVASTGVLPSHTFVTSLLPTILTHFDSKNCGKWNLSLPLTLLFPCHLSSCAHYHYMGWYIIMQCTCTSTPPPPPPSPPSPLPPHSPAISSAWLEALLAAIPVAPKDTLKHQVHNVQVCKVHCL